MTAKTDWIKGDPSNDVSQYTVCFPGLTDTHHFQKEVNMWPFMYEESDWVLVNDDLRGERKVCVDKTAV